MTFSLSGHAAHGSCLGADGRGRNLYRSRLFRDSDHVDRVIDRSRRYSGSTDRTCCRCAASLSTRRRGPFIHCSRDKAEDVPGDTRDVRHVPRQGAPCQRMPDPEARPRNGELESLPRGIAGRGRRSAQVRSTECAAGVTMQRGCGGWLSGFGSGSSP